MTEENKNVDPVEEPHERRNDLGAVSAVDSVKS